MAKMAPIQAGLSTAWRFVLDETRVDQYNPYVPGTPAGSGVIRQNLGQNPIKADAVSY